MIDKFENDIDALIDDMANKPEDYDIAKIHDQQNHPEIVENARHAAKLICSSKDDFLITLYSKLAILSVDKSGRDKFLASIIRTLNNLSAIEPQISQLVLAKLIIAKKGDLNFKSAIYDILLNNASLAKQFLLENFIKTILTPTELVIIFKKHFNTLEQIRSLIEFSSETGEKLKTERADLLIKLADENTDIAIPLCNINGLEKVFTKRQLRNLNLYGFGEKKIKPEAKQTKPKKSIDEFMDELIEQLDQTITKDELKSVFISEGSAPKPADVNTEVVSNQNNIPSTMEMPKEPVNQSEPSNAASASKAFLDQITNKGLSKLLNENKEFLNKIIEINQNKPIDINALNQVGTSKITPRELLQAFNERNKEVLTAITESDERAQSLYNDDIRDGGKRIYEYEIRKVQNELKEVFPDLKSLDLKQQASIIFNANAEERVKKLIEKIENDRLKKKLLEQDLVKLDRLNINDTWVNEVNAILKQKEKTGKETFAKKLKEKCEQLQVNIDFPNEEVFKENIAKFNNELSKFKSNLVHLKKITSLADLQGNLLSRNSGSIMEMHKKFQKLIENINELRLHGTSTDFEVIDKDIEEINKFFSTVEIIFTDIPNLQAKLKVAIDQNDSKNIRHYQRELNIVCQATSQDNISYIFANVIKSPIELKQIIQSYKELVKERIVPAALESSQVFSTSSDAEGFNRILNNIESLIKNGPIDLKSFDRLIVNSANIISKNPEIAQRVKSLIELANDKIAGAIFTKDQQLFAKLNPDELFNLVNFSNEETCPGIVAITRNSNALTRTVIAQLFDNSEEKTSLEQFTLTLGHWIEIAYKLYKNSNNARDYAGIHAILSAFSHASIARLIGDINQSDLKPNAVLASLPKSTLNHLNELREIPRGNMGKFVAHMEKHKGATIPFIGAYQTNSIMTSESTTKLIADTDAGKKASEKVNSMKVALEPFANNGSINPWLNSMLEQCDSIQQDSFDQKVNELSDHYSSKKQQPAERKYIWANLNGSLQAEGVTLRNILDQVTEDKKIIVENGNLKVDDKNKSLFGIAGTSVSTREAFNKYLNHIEETSKTDRPDFELFDKLITSSWGHQILVVNVAKKAVKNNDQLVERTNEINQKLVNSFVKVINSRTDKLILDLTEEQIADVDNHTNKEKCPSIVALTELFNNLVGYFYNAVVAEASPEIALLNIDRAIKCAYQFYLSGNYFCMSAVLSALYNPIIERLILTNDEPKEPTDLFKKLSKEAQEYYTFLKPYTNPNMLPELMRQAQGKAIAPITKMLNEVKLTAENDKNFKKSDCFLKTKRALEEMQASLKDSNPKDVNIDWLCSSNTENHLYDLSKQMARDASKSSPHISATIKTIINADDNKLAALENIVLRDIIFYTEHEHIIISDKNIKALNNFVKLSFDSPESAKTELRSLLEAAGLKLSDSDFINVYIEMKRLQVNYLWEKLSATKEQLKQIGIDLSEASPSSLKISSAKQSNEFLKEINFAQSKKRVEQVIELEKSNFNPGNSQLITAYKEIPRAISDSRTKASLMKNVAEYRAVVVELQEERILIATTLRETKFSKLPNDNEIIESHKKNLLLLRNSMLHETLQNPVKSNGYLLSQSTVDLFNEALWLPSDKESLKLLFNSLKISLTDTQIQQISDENTRLRKLIAKIENPHLITILKDPKQPIKLGKEFNEELLNTELLARLNGKSVFNQADFNKLMGIEGLITIDKKHQAEIFLSANKKYFAQLADLLKEISTASYSELAGYREKYNKLKNDYRNVGPDIEQHIKNADKTVAKEYDEYFDNLMKQLDETSIKLSQRKKLLELASLIKDDGLFHLIKSNKFGIIIPKNVTFNQIKELADALNQLNKLDDVKDLFNKLNITVTKADGFYKELDKVAEVANAIHKLDEKYQAIMAKLLIELKQLGLTDWKLIALTNEEIEAEIGKVINKDENYEEFIKLVEGRKLARNIYFMEVKDFVEKFNNEIRRPIPPDYSNAMQSSTKPFGADEEVPVISKIIADSGGSLADIEAIENLDKVLSSKAFSKYNRGLMNAELGYAFTSMNAPFGLLKPVYLIQNYANKSHIEIFGVPNKTTDTLIQKHKELLEKETIVDNDIERAEYIQELQQARMHVLEKITNISEKIDEALELQAELLKIDNRLNEDRVTTYGILEKSIASLKEQKAKLEGDFNKLTSIYDKQNVILLQNEVQTYNLNNLTESQAFKLLEAGVRSLFENWQIQIEDSKCAIAANGNSVLNADVFALDDQQVSSLIAIDGNRPVVAVLKSSTPLNTFDETGKIIQQREQHYINLIDNYFQSNASGAIGNKQLLAFAADVIAYIDSIENSLDLNKIRSQDPNYNTADSLIANCEGLCIHYEKLANVLRRQLSDSSKIAEFDNFIPPHVLQKILDLVNNKIKALQVEISKLKEPLKAELEAKQKALNTQQELYANSVSKIIGSVKNNSSEQWEKDTNLNKYNIGVYTSTKDNLDSFHHVGSNGRIKVGDFTAKNAYNDARMEDFYERGLLCIKAAENLVKIHFANNEALKSFLEKRLKNFKKAIEADCNIDPKGKTPEQLEQAFEKAYKNAVKIHKQLLIDVADSLVNAAREVVKGNPDQKPVIKNRDEAIELLRKQEQVHLFNVGRPDIYHIYTSGDIEQIDVQTTLEAKTTPSHMRSVIDGHEPGLANAVKEIHAHKVEGKVKGQDTIKVDFITYRAGEHPYEIKDKKTRLEATEKNAERLLGIMIADRLAVDKDMGLGGPGKPLTISISSMILLSSWAGSQIIRGEADEIRMVKESVLAWRMLMHKQQPLKLNINGKEETVYVKIDLAEMNMAVKPIISNVISDVELNLNERGYYQFAQQTEVFLGNHLARLLEDAKKDESTSIDIADEEKLEMIKSLQDKINDAYKNSAELQNGIENLVALQQELKPELDRLYRELAKASNNSEDCKKIIEKIDKCESKLDLAYKQVNEAKRKIWAGAAQQKNLKALIDLASVLSKETKREDVKKYCTVIQEYAEAQALFFDTNIFNRKSYNEKDNWYEFQARFIHIGYEIGNFTKFKCKSLEDRTGKLAEIIKARSVFQQLNGRLPKLGDDTDNKKLEELMKPIEDYSVSRENTGLNGWGARGKQTGTPQERKMAKLDKGFYSWAGKLKPLSPVKSIKNFIEYINKKAVDVYGRKSANDEQLVIPTTINKGEIEGLIKKVRHLSRLYHKAFNRLMKAIGRENLVNNVVELANLLEDITNTKGIQQLARSAKTNNSNKELAKLADKLLRHVQSAYDYLLSEVQALQANIKRAKDKPGSEHALVKHSEALSTIQSSIIGPARDLGIDTKELESSLDEIKLPENNISDSPAPVSSSQLRDTASASNDSLSTQQSVTPVEPETVIVKNIQATSRQTNNHLSGWFEYIQSISESSLIKPSQNKLVKTVAEVTKKPGDLVHIEPHKDNLIKSRRGFGFDLDLTNGDILYKKPDAPTKARSESADAAEIANQIAKMGNDKIRIDIPAQGDYTHFIELLLKDLPKRINKPIMVELYNKDGTLRSQHPLEPKNAASGFFKKRNDGYDKLDDSNNSELKNTQAPAISVGGRGKK